MNKCARASNRFRKCVKYSTLPTAIISAVILGFSNNVNKNVICNKNTSIYIIVLVTVYFRSALHKTLYMTYNIIIMRGRVGK